LALAAGFAALVIHCVRLGAVYYAIKSKPHPKASQQANGTGNTGDAADSSPPVDGDTVATTMVSGEFGLVNEKDQMSLNKTSLAAIKEHYNTFATFVHSRKVGNVFDKPGQLISVEITKLSNNDKMREVVKLANRFSSST
jgi:hypothetical protein